MTKQSLKRRIGNIEDRITKKRVVWVWVDNFEQPTTYTLGDKTITAAELADLEADPTVKVIKFVWVDDTGEAEYEQYH